MEKKEPPSGVHQGHGGSDGEGGYSGKVMHGDILREFVRVMHDVIPILDQMKSSIQESSHKIPRAAVQLSNVTRATEDATVEILNVLDSMTQRISGFETLLLQLDDRKTKLRTLGEEITQCFEGLVLGEQAGEELAGLQRLWLEYFARSTDREIMDQARLSLSGARDEAMSIAVALQVQDITSQQIAGVIDLIESVRSQLIVVLRNLENDQDARSAPVEVRPLAQADSNTFNPEAEFCRNPERQEIADDIVNNWKSMPPQGYEGKPLSGE